MPWRIIPCLVYEIKCSATKIWWRHQMETFSALLAICAGNSPVPGEFPAQRPVTRSFDVFFDLRLNKRLSKQSWGWRFETPSCPLWCHRNYTINYLRNIHNRKPMIHPWRQSTMWLLWVQSLNDHVILERFIAASKSIFLFTKPIT